MKSIGLVLHPARDSAAAVAAVLDWAARKRAEVLGIDAEIERLNCAAVAVTAAELGRARTFWSASAGTARCCAPCGWPTGSARRCWG